MDSAQKKLGSPHPLPVSATVAKETTAARPAAVALVSAWALCTAIVFVLSYAITSLFFLLTDSRAAEESALKIGRLCCAALQAAAAVLALRLPCRRLRVRYAFAYLALALTFVNHCMFAAELRLLIVADPGDHFFRILCIVGIFLCAVGDILSFLALLLGLLLGVGGEEE